MEITVCTMIIVLLAMVGVGVAIVLPLTGWLTYPVAITEADVHWVMTLWALAGFTLMLIIICCVGKVTRLSFFELFCH